MSPSTEADNQLPEIKKLLQDELIRAKSAIQECNDALTDGEATLTILNEQNTIASQELSVLNSRVITAPAEILHSAYGTLMDLQQKVRSIQSDLEKRWIELAGWERYSDLIISISKRLSLSSFVPNQENEKTRLEKVVNAQESVRMRLSRQMHDGPSQAFSNLILRVEIISRLLDLDPGKAKEEIEKLKASMAMAFQMVKSYVFELSPITVHEKGLATTLQKYIDNFVNQTGVAVRLSVQGGDRRYQPYGEILVVRICQELINDLMNRCHDLPENNIVTLDVVCDDDLIQLMISEDIMKSTGSKSAPVEGAGIMALRQRLEYLGDSVQINEIMGDGIQIDIIIPCLK